MRILLCLLALAAFAVAQEETEAERAYRDGWWYETGSGELPKALKAYHDAAEAKGPDVVRAKALLKKATLQHRLGRTADALKTIENLTQRFPDEEKTLAEAAALAKEWTAVDLRRSYGDWYKRYLFSPEYQAKVVDWIQSLGNEDLVKTRVNEARGRLLASGEAAVPALREAAVSRNRTLAERASELMLELGAMPPPEVLIEHNDWAKDPDYWAAILTSMERGLLTSAKGGDAFAYLVRGAGESPEKLLGAIVSEAGAETLMDFEKAVAAAVWGIYQLRDEALRVKVVEASLASETPLAVRDFLQLLICEDEWEGGTAKLWMEWGTEAANWDAKSVAMRRIGRRMRRGDPLVLDGLLRYLSGLDRSVSATLLEHFADGLNGNPVPLQIPWTPDRIRAWMKLSLELESWTIFQTFAKMRRDRNATAVLVTALLDDPVQVLSFQERFDWGQILSPEGIEEEQWIILESRWSRAIADGIGKRWTSWTEEQRAAVRKLIAEQHLIHEEARVPNDLEKLIKFTR